MVAPHCTWNKILTSCSDMYGQSFCMINGVGRRNADEMAGATAASLDSEVTVRKEATCQEWPSRKTAEPDGHGQAMPAWKAHIWALGEKYKLLY